MGDHDTREPANLRGQNVGVRGAHRKGEVKGCRWCCSLPENWLEVRDGREELLQRPPETKVG